MRIPRILIVGAILPALASCSVQETERPDKSGAALRFSIAEGQSRNHFIRQGGVSAHLNLQTYPAPRIIVAFPAGNSGAALFFGKTTGDGPVWGEINGIETIERTDGSGRTLYGIQAEIDIEVAALGLHEADIGSIRFLRDAVDYSSLPPRPAPEAHTDGNRVRFTRERPDGRSSYFMEVEVLAGQLRQAGGVRFVAGEDGTLRIRVLAASGDPLEPPFSAGGLLAEGAGRDRALRDALSFLTYESKMLAGSWRFLTYFGRDTLLAVRLLMPVLTADAAEIGLGSVLERVNDRGEVAHEEEIGELAVFRNLAEHDRASAEPVYDYDMVDDNLLLAPVLSHYVETFGDDRAAVFLSGSTAASEPYRFPLTRNLLLVVEQASAFADDPIAANLLSIKEGLNDGNWRDSEEGLVGGRYPYDVNAVLMPAALRAAASLVGSDLLGGNTDSLPGEQELLRMAGVWEAHAARFFRVSVASEQAREKVDAYAGENGYPSFEAPEMDAVFYAVALDAGFQPIPVMHSDVGTDLLFLRRPESYLREIITSLTREFPAGLATRIGVLAANPVFADIETQALVTRNHYHGTVVWSWQQAMIIAGIDTQLRRDDLSAALQQELRAARRKIWQGVRASDDIINSELWSFAVQGDEYVIAPFGQSAGHLTESNAVQLWSTVFLALAQDAATPR